MDIHLAEHSGRPEGKEDVKYENVGHDQRLQLSLWCLSLNSQNTIKFCTIDVENNPYLSNIGP